MDKLMKLQSWLLAALITMVFALPARAQITGEDIGGILNEIFKGQKKNPDTGTHNSSVIDNIPVDIHFETGESGLPENAMLVISAYQPPPPNARLSAPLLIGQTRLLLTGLSSPLSVVIAAPSAVTKDLDFARLDAQILDMNGNPLFELKDSAQYRGYETPILTLDKTSNMQDPSRPAEDELTYETVRGRVVLNGPPPTYRGSNLVVRLIENGLAGGVGSFIAGEHRQAIDQKTAPFNFTINRVIDPSRAAVPLAFRVWIEDWAGRKTHVTPRPIPFNGAKTRYRLRLDTISVGPEAVPDLVTGEPPASAQRNIEGLTRFDASKGLPAGSALTAELVRHYESGNPTIIAQTLVQLDGLSGDVAFTVVAPETAFDPRLPSPVLRVRIKSKDGKLFFKSAQDTPLNLGMNTVQLSPTPQY